MDKGLTKAGQPVFDILQKEHNKHIGTVVVSMELIKKLVGRNTIKGSSVKEYILKYFTREVSENTDFSVKTKLMKNNKFVFFKLIEKKDGARNGEKNG